MKKIVVKIGGSLIAPRAVPDAGSITAFVSDIAGVQAQAARIIVVSSGAVACGSSILGVAKRPTVPCELMALASLGQITLMDYYAQAFKRYKMLCAQILLTRDDFDIRKRFLNGRRTINRLLELGVVPVINENDAVSDDEIKFGDNDRLSALVADMIQADMLIILSDVQGLLDAHGAVIRVVPKVDASVHALVRRKKDAFTSGGMTTKLQAANICTTSGIVMVLADGKEQRIVSRIVQGEMAGTTFLPQEEITKARKRWIAYGKNSRGTIVIDDGAQQAILAGGKSLLRVGIMRIEGDFKKNDAVDIVTSGGGSIGRGIVNYSAQELSACGRGRLPKEVIHRDNFVANQDQYRLTQA